jgi:hypothetical protein
MYQLLFCDRPEMFRPQPGTQMTPWQTALFAPSPDTVAVRAVAEDQSMASRYRVLAYNWLRRNGQTAPRRELFGVIVEVPLEGGQETLAAFPDGAVRYINKTGRFSIFEPAPPAVREQAEELLAAARAALVKLGPWDKDRLPAPRLGNARVSFLVSDGLYFGEGQLPGIDRDEIGGPIFHEAGKLLTAVVDTAVG